MKWGGGTERKHTTGQDVKHSTLLNDTSSIQGLKIQPDRGATMWSLR